MRAESICDGCGKRAPMEAGALGTWHKPRDWYERSDADGIQTACSRECIEKIAKASGKTAKSPQPSSLLNRTEAAAYLGLRPQTLATWACVQRYPFWWLAVLLVFVAGSLCCNSLGAEPDPLGTLLAAIREVESSGGRDKGDGDDGAALGPYQIHRDYWTDSGVPGRWEDCRSEPYARRVVLGYWRRYEPAALARVNAEVLARCHNGGWNWRKKATTMAYWRKVRKMMGDSY